MDVNLRPISLLIAIVQLAVKRHLIDDDDDDDDDGDENSSMDELMCLFGIIYLVPAYLDHLVRPTPSVVHPKDYGLPADANAGRPDPLVTRFHGSDPPPPPQELELEKELEDDKTSRP
jgi:hypothetical protein